MTLDMWSVLARAFGWGGVIAYHGVGESPALPVMHVSPARLRAQLEYLVAHHRVVSLRELVERWQSGASTADCVAITFDDAYAGVAVHALPILRELDLPATVFVVDAHARHGATFWWDDVERDRQAAAANAWVNAPRTLGFGRLAADADSALAVRSRVLAGYAGRWPEGLTADPHSVWRSLTYHELADLAVYDRIDFGVHTLTHPALPVLAHDEQVREMRDSHARMREHLPRVLPVIAYPYGLYDRRTVLAATEAGMIAGVTMEGRASADRPDRMIVPRIGAGEVHAPTSLSRRLHRALRPALVLRNRSIHPRMPRDPLPHAPRPSQPSAS